MDVPHTNDRREELARPMEPFADCVEVTDGRAAPTTNRNSKKIPRACPDDESTIAHASKRFSGRLTKVAPPGPPVMTVRSSGPPVGNWSTITRGFVLALVGVAGLVWIRTVVGDTLGDSVHPMTYAGVAGGLFGAAVMLVVIDATLVEGQPPAVEFYGYYLGNGTPSEYRGAGTALHLLYGALAGGFYPRLAHLAGLSGDVWATLPWAVATAVGFATVLFLVGVGYGLVGLFRFDVEPSQVGHFLGFHLLYGVSLGITVGAWQAVA